ncbi:hypothetical protein DFH27DRAFT_656389 [Peziza echinospora]|nr:hypothetical protein DFH27DRAFT_656389 [Peziza echinospora]
MKRSPKRLSEFNVEEVLLPHTSPWSSGSKWQLAKPLCALLFVLLLAATAGAILSTSDGKPTNLWPWGEDRFTSIRRFITPTVLLAAIATISNILLRYAYSEAMVMQWWREALHPQSVSDLHHGWEYGYSTLGALTSRLKCNGFHLLSWTNIVVALAAAQGTLFQRASRVVVVGDAPVRHMTITVRAPPRELAPDVISGPIGEGLSFKNQYRFMQANIDHNLGTPVALAYTGCNGTCVATIVAPGFDFRCAAGARPYDLGMHSAGEWAPVFSSELRDFAARNLDRADFHSVHKPAGGCQGTLIVKNCTAHNAVVRYNVTLTNQTAALAPIGDTALNHTVRLVYGDYAEVRNATHKAYNASNVHGLINYLGGEMGSSKWVRRVNGMVDVARGGGMLLNTLQTHGGDACNETWTDPTERLMHMMRDVMFRAAIMDFNEKTLSDYQTVAATEAGIITLYQSDPQYGLVGLCFPVAGALFIMCLMWGCRDQGRAVTLSPVEIARAFGAAVLIDAGSNSTVEEILEQVGSELKIQYGDNASGGVGFDDASKVRRPKLGREYQ